MNEYELTEFFGVLPTEDEDRCYKNFRVERNSTILNFGLFSLVGFSLSLSHKETNEPVFSTGFEGDFKIERMFYKNNYDCLKLIIPFEKSYRESNWDYSYTIIIFVEPNIKVKILS